MPNRPPAIIDPAAPANPTQIVVLQSRDIQAKLIDSARPVGRPKLDIVIFEEELLDRLRCGQSLLSICRKDHMPSYAWCQTLADRDAAFGERLDRARQRGMEALFDLQIDIMSGGEFSTGETHRDRELVSDQVDRWQTQRREVWQSGRC